MWTLHSGTAKAESFGQPDDRGLRFTVLSGCSVADGTCARFRLEKSLRVREGSRQQIADSIPIFGPRLGGDGEGLAQMRV
jgi:hypothetical protein